MIKIFCFLKRRPSADFYAFREYFRVDFVRDVLASDPDRAISRIVTNYVLEQNVRPPTNADGHHWDAVAEVYVDDEQAAERLLNDRAFVAAHFARPDMVIEISHSVVLETTVIDQSPPLTAPKVFGFFRNSLPLGNPMSREEMGRRWEEHVVRMREKGLGGLLTGFQQNRTLIPYHSVNPRYDYDGASIIWCESVEVSEQLYKSYEAEQAYIASSAEMGGTPGDCYYVRTDFVESYRRAG